MVASCRHAGNNRPGERKQDEVRELHCACGNRLVAEMDLGEGQLREMVASQASDTDDAPR